MFIIRMQKLKAKKWKKWKLTGFETNRSSYNEIMKKYRKEIRSYYSNVELNLMKSKKNGSLYRYIGRKIYSRTGMDEILLADGTTKGDQGYC